MFVVFCATGAGAQTNLPAAREYPLITIAGKSYSNATVKATSPVDGLVSFPAGGAKISLEDLPEPARGHFYSEEKAKVFRNEQAVIAQKRAADRELGRVKDVESYKARNVRLVGDREINISELQELSGRIEQVFPDRGGIVMRRISHTWIAGTSSGGNMLGGSSGGYMRTTESDTLTFVRLEPKGLVDGQKFSVKAFKLGTTNFTLMDGGTVTMTLYDVGAPYTMK